jgi:hypothetical protein
VIEFNDVLVRGGFRLDDIRLVRHAEPNALEGRSPYLLWRDQRTAFDFYQQQQGDREHRTLEKATHWASFVADPLKKTMFVGFYRAKYVGKNTVEVISPTTDKRNAPGDAHMYELHLDKFLSEYIGRLFIDWGPGPIAIVQYAAGRKNKAITEIRVKFEEDAFPGYAEFISNLSLLEGLPPSWIRQLSTVKGVYALTCPKEKLLYVGAAYGDDGFYGRWRQYAVDGHGGNIRLKSRDRSDYQVSILEVAGSSASVEDIAKLESRWKEKLQTREMGLNAN